MGLCVDTGIIRAERVHGRLVVGIHLCAVSAVRRRILYSGSSAGDGMLSVRFHPLFGTRIQDVDGLLQAVDVWF